MRPHGACDEAAEHADVQEMLVYEGGDVAQAVNQLSEPYELTGADGSYRVFCDGRVVSFIRVRLCDDGVQLLIKPNDVACPNL